MSLTKYKSKQIKNIFYKLFQTYEKKLVYIFNTFSSFFATPERQELSFAEFLIIFLNVHRKDAKFCDKFFCDVFHFF